MKRSVIAAAALAGVCGGLALAVTSVRQPEPERPAAPLRTAVRMLPGAQPGGFIRLPNQWSLRPAGRQTVLGDFPVQIALHPTAPYMAVLHAGHGPHEVIVLSLEKNTPKITCRVAIDQAFYGLCWTPDGKTLYASGGEHEVVHAFTFDDGLLGRGKSIRIRPVWQKFVPGGLAVDAAGKTLFAAGTWGHQVALVPIDDPMKMRTVDLEKDSYPYACLSDAEGKRLFVSLWGKAAIAVIDLDSARVIGTWPTDLHPTEMALSPKGDTLYVACANSTHVRVLGTKHDGRSVETIHAALYPNAPAGNTPNSLCLTPDGEVLFVANADANNLAVFNVAERGNAKSLGFIPVGWYPTSVRYRAEDKKLYVANGKGLTSRANPHGPGPYQHVRAPIYQYIGSLMQGTLSSIEAPTPKRMGEYTKQAFACSPLREDRGVTAERPADSPIPGAVGDPSPIKHCVYIIKENRTYDQVFGDLPEGNGDPGLCIFGAKVTPNHHRLARQFVLLDNFYVEGEVSADGHEWTMGAYATDFIEKVWPLTYRTNLFKKFDFYPAEGNFDTIARPAGGYLWDRCAEAGVSYRSYGEWVKNGKTPKDPATATVKALEGHIDSWFRAFDLAYSDQKRADRFLEEFRDFEKKGELPQFIVMHLPNDHTSGAKVGLPSPRAAVADNDLALGRIVEAISKSKFWKDTAIFVVEDDAQNGPDHVDAHRTVAFVISPYTKHAAVDSSLYSTSSMARTIELILGLKPMSQFDAAARPMYAAFQAKADLAAYEHVVPEVDLEEKNTAAAWGAKLSEGFDLTREDAADDLLLNEVVWRSVKGAKNPMPAPVRAAFVFPKVKGPAKDDDD
jgi:DNA-binding beta-propeller fold protein YncE